MLTSIDELKKEGFIIAGIVSDNLRVQVSSIHEVIEEKGFFFHIACGNHCIHNAIKDACLENEMLGAMVKELENFTNFMNRKDVLSQLQLAIPKRCLTRWTNVFDIAHYIVLHYAKISSFFNNKETYDLATFSDVDTLETVFNVLHHTCFILSIILFPFKIISEKLESDQSTCGYIFGYEYAALIKMTQIGVAVPELSELCDSLCRAVKIRLDEKKRLSAEPTSFSTNSYWKAN